MAFKIRNPFKKKKPESPPPVTGGGSLPPVTFKPPSPSDLSSLRPVASGSALPKITPPPKTGGGSGGSRSSADVVIIADQGTSASDVAREISNQINSGMMEMKQTPKIIELKPPKVPTRPRGSGVLSSPRISSGDTFVSVTSGGQTMNLETPIKIKDRTAQNIKTIQQQAELTRESILRESIATDKANEKKLEESLKLLKSNQGLEDTATGDRIDLYERRQMKEDTETQLRNIRLNRGKNQNELKRLTESEKNQRVLEVNVVRDPFSGKLNVSVGGNASDRELRELDSKYRKLIEEGKITEESTYTEYFKIGAKTAEKVLQEEGRPGFVGTSLRTPLLEGFATTYEVVTGKAEEAENRFNIQQAQRALFLKDEEIIRQQEEERGQREGLSKAQIRNNIATRFANLENVSGEGADFLSGPINIPILAVSGAGISAGLKGAGQVGTALASRSVLAGKTVLGASAPALIGLATEASLGLSIATPFVIERVKEFRKADTTGKVALGLLTATEIASLGLSGKPSVKFKGRSKTSVVENGKVETIQKPTDLQITNIEIVGRFAKIKNGMIRQFDVIINAVDKNTGKEITFGSKGRQRVTNGREQIVLETPKQESNGIVIDQQTKILDSQMKNTFKAKIRVIENELKFRSKEKATATVPNEFTGFLRQTVEQDLGKFDIQNPLFPKQRVQAGKKLKTQVTARAGETEVTQLETIEASLGLPKPSEVNLEATLFGGVRGTRQVKQAKPEAGRPLTEIVSEDIFPEFRQEKVGKKSVQLDKRENPFDQSQNLALDQFNARTERLGQTPGQDIIIESKGLRSKDILSASGTISRRSGKTRFSIDEINQRALDRIFGGTTRGSKPPKPPRRGGGQPPRDATSDLINNVNLDSLGGRERGVSGARDILNNAPSIDQLAGFQKQVPRSPRNVKGRKIKPESTATGRTQSLEGLAESLSGERFTGTTQKTKIKNPRGKFGVEDIYGRGRKVVSPPRTRNPYDSLNELLYGRGEIGTIPKQVKVRPRETKLRQDSGLRQQPRQRARPRTATSPDIGLPDISIPSLNEGGLPGFPGLPIFGDVDLGGEVGGRGSRVVSKKNRIATVEELLGF